MEIYLFLIYVSFFIGVFAAIFYSLCMISHYREKKDIPEMACDKSVSIIIPAYNEEKSIIRTLESAINIDYPDDKIEIIVVNDGSSDNTLKLAERFKKEYNGKRNILVLSKKNGGKGTAINYGIKKAKGEIVFTMDADSFVIPSAVQRMIAKFQDPDVMCVAPSVLAYKPKKILEYVCDAEYFLGIFLRKAFSTVNSIHITPGAFSSYRKVFFDKHGGFDENNLTEDMELALRIQSKGYKIDYSIRARVYTIVPFKFKTLLLQRRRWYMGLIKNLWAYRHLFGPKTGIMGIFVLPVALVSILLSVILTVYVFFRLISDIHDAFTLLKSVNFNFTGIFEINRYFLENLLYGIFSNAQLLMFILFLCIIGFYIFFGRKTSEHKEGLKLSLLFFLLFYAMLFSFWWIISLLYLGLNKKVGWGGNAERKSKKKY